MVVERKRTVTGLLLIVGALYSHAAYGSTYYVGKTGQNTNSCAQAQSPSTPKLTINNAVGCLSAGDTLYVRGGTYDETLDNNVPSGSSWSSPVRIAAYAGETVIMQPSRASCTFAVLAFSRNQQYIEFDGINMDGRNCTYWTVKFESGTSPSLYDPHHIRIKNAELTGTDNLLAGNQFTVIVMVASSYPSAVGHHEFINLTLHRGPARRTDYRTNGFYFHTPDNVIDGADVYDMLGFGVQLYDENVGFSNPDRTIIRNSRFHDFPARQSGWISTVGHNYGVVVAQGGGSKVYNNLVYNILTGEGASGVGTTLGSHDTEIYNNTIVGGAAEGITIGSSVTGAIVRNNISYGNRGSDFADYGSRTTVSNNLTGVNPQFVNAAGGNFQLQSSSPAIDSGVSVAVVTTDFNRMSRPQGKTYDIGAYEYGSSQAVPPASSAPTAPTGVRIVSN